MMDFMLRSRDELTSGNLKDGRASRSVATLGVPSGQPQICCP